MAVSQFVYSLYSEFNLFTGITCQEWFCCEPLYMSLGECTYIFLLGACPGVELLGHRASVYAASVDTENSFLSEHVHSHLLWLLLMDICCFLFFILAIFVGCAVVSPLVLF